MAVRPDVDSVDPGFFDLYDHNAWVAARNTRLLPKREVDPNKYTKWNGSLIQNAVADNIVFGKGYRDLANSFERVVGMDKNVAMRNARTALGAARNAGFYTGIKNAEKKLGMDVKKQWMAFVDNVTRDSHVDVDGEVVKIGENFSNGMEYPCGPGPAEEVYNCRCTMLAVIDDRNWEASEWYKDGIRGKPGEAYESMKEKAHQRIEARRQRNQPAQPTITPAPTKTAVETTVEKLANGEQPTTQDFIDAGAEVQKEVESTQADLLAKREELKKKSDEAEAQKVKLKAELDSTLQSVNAYFDAAYKQYGYTDKWPQSVLDGYKVYEDMYNAARSNYTNFFNPYTTELQKIDDALNSTRGQVIARMRGETQGFPSWMGKKDIASHFDGATRVNKGRVALESAYNKYPSSWVQASAGYGNITTGSTGRGYCTIDGSTIMISGWDDTQKMQTGVHELGHRFESVFPVLRDAESAFYQYRTTGETSQSLRDLTGIDGYSSWEVAKPDQFADPYMGKDYGDPNNQRTHFEIFSMGAETVLGGSGYNLDDEYRNFIVGMLVTIGR